MDLKNAAFLALVGTALATLLLVFSLIGDVLGVARGVVPAMRLVPSFVYAFAGFTVVMFFYAFHRGRG
jgi:ABC-type xylose transport system permease subunit